MNGPAFKFIPPPVPTTKSAVNDPGKTKPTAMLADDSIPMRGRVRRWLRTAGFNVIGESTNAVEALRTARKLRPNLVSLDVLMEPGSGLDVAIALAGDKQIAHIVIVSSNSQETVFGPLADLGIHAIVKPVADDEGIRIFQRILEGKCSCECCRIRKQKIANANH